MLERFGIAPHLIHEAVDMSPHPRNLFKWHHRKILAQPYSIEMKLKFHCKWASQYLPWGHSRLIERGPDAYRIYGQMGASHQAINSINFSWGDFEGHFSCLK